MNSHKAILFDLDGTLRDTKEVIYPALEHAIRTHASRVPSRQEMAAYIHHHSEVHKQFAPDVSWEEFDRTYFAKITELMPSAKVYAGVFELLAYLQAAGYKLALVTSAGHPRDYLQSIGAEHYFDVVVGGLDTDVHKPHPAPVRLALRQLDVPVKNTAFIGDLPADMLAAKAADVPITIGITHGFGGRKELAAVGADYLIGSLAEVPAILANLAS